MLAAVGAVTKEEPELNDENSTEQEVAEFKKAFKMWDRDGDGTITFNELSSVFKSLGQSYDHNKMKTMFEQADLDGNGSIDFAEFLALMTNRMESSATEDSIRESLTPFDHELEGRVAPSKLKQILMHIGDKVTEEELEVVLSFMDKDDEGFIDMDEMISTLMLTS